jgi:hypothetical protein
MIILTAEYEFENHPYEPFSIASTEDEARELAADWVRALSPDDPCPERIVAWTPDFNGRYERTVIAEPV